MQGDRVVIDGEYFHYLAHVRRLKKGSAVGAVIGEHRYDLAVSEIGPAAITFEILSRREVAVSGSSDIHVYQGLLKSTKLDLAVAKLSELGARELVLLKTERSIPDPLVGPNRLERWNRLAREGAKVSGIERLMEIRGPLMLSAVKDLLGTGAGRAVLVFCPEKGSVHVREALDSMPVAERAPVHLFFGPEGGFSEGEVELLKASGGIPVSMGDFVLRAETAAIVGTGFVRVYCEAR